MYFIKLENLRLCALDDYTRNSSGVGNNGGSSGGSSGGGGAGISGEVDQECNDRSASVGEKSIVADLKEVVEISDQDDVDEDMDAGYDDECNDDGDDAGSDNDGAIESCGGGGKYDLPASVHRRLYQHQQEGVKWLAQVLCWWHICIAHVYSCVLRRGLGEFEDLQSTNSQLQ